MLWQAAPGASPQDADPARAPLVRAIRVDDTVRGHLHFHPRAPRAGWPADEVTEADALVEAIVRAIPARDPMAGAPDTDLLDALPVAVLGIDRDAVIRHANPAFRALTGHPPEALAGRTLTDLLRAPDDEGIGTLRYADETLHPAVIRRPVPANQEVGLIYVCLLPPPATDTAQLHDLAFHDSVTGLPNRHVLAHGQTTGNTVIAIRILDRIDPSLPAPSTGIPAVPTAIAESIRAALGTRPHLLIRSGESGLAVVTEADSETALELARAIRTPFKGLLKIGARRLPVQISIGIAQGDRPLPQLLMDAEFACHPERAGAIHRFETALRTRLQERQQLEADLFTALQTEDPGFSIALQPTVALESGIVVGFEVLARWLHPERGAISPAVFVPMAESTGLMLALGTRVLELAARTVQRWNQLRSARDLPPVFVSANLSAHQFMDPDLIDALAIIVGRTRVAPGHLRLELTEATLMARPAHTAAALGSITRLGIGLSIDDFGHGPSCLGHLHRFTVDAIKIDRQFVAGVSRSARERATLSALIQLARALGLEPVAEGIEAADTATALVAMGCALGQGFHFGRPMAVEEAEALILPPV
ncbi:putative bifunctional diguanylate cyclase/phosphodiesterase [Segnochrobactraceae bacterium EtOH-i3]